MSGPINAGVIGLGVGEQHVQALLGSPRSNLVGACDIDPEKCADVATRFPHLNLTTNPADLIEDTSIDLLCIASYDDAHFEQMDQAISNGKHVFVEKPLCMHESELQRIRERLFEQPHIKMSSNLILRHSPRFQDVKQRIVDGDLGQLYFIAGDYNYGRVEKITKGWRGKQAFYSIMLGGGVHIVDLLLWLTGEKVEEVVTQGNSLATDGTDFRFNSLVTSILRFRNGIVGSVTANFACVMPHFHKFSIYGTEATFENAADHGLLYTSRDPEVPAQKLDTEYPGVHKGSLLLDFLEALHEESEPEITIDEIFDTMSVCLAIEKSMASGTPVKVNYT
jgi:predicted dehydrogenase